VLPAGRPTWGVRVAAGSQDAHAAPEVRFGVHQARPQHGRSCGDLQLPQPRRLGACERGAAMIDAPSSTWFTVNPHWQWYIVFYFFIGGRAGGCYFLAPLIDFFGRPEDRPLARLGYYVAFPAVLLSGLLLTVDLTRPLRFWHMLIERNTFEPMFKPWSPMSVGSWALLLFGFFTFISFLAALADDDRVHRPVLRRLQYPAFRRFHGPTVLGRIVGVLGGFFGLFLAGYTGVLLAVTNRPIWSDTPLLGLLFIVSAASTSAALLMLLAQRYGW